VADNGQVSLAPEIVLRKTVVKAGKNDSVASVSKHYRVSPANLADWNKVPVSSSFKQGQQIVLFLPPVRSQKQATQTKQPGQATTKVKPTQVARR
jgi:membrane-bound lytic murein transglycosylase D